MFAKRLKCLFLSISCFMCFLALKYIFLFSARFLSLFVLIDIFLKYFRFPNTIFNQEIGIIFVSNTLQTILYIYLGQYIEVKLNIDNIENIERALKKTILHLLKCHCYILYINGNCKWYTAMYRFVCRNKLENIHWDCNLGKTG